MWRVTFLMSRCLSSGRLTRVASAGIVMSGSRVPVVFQLVHSLYHVSVCLLGSCPMMIGMYSFSMLMSSAVVLILTLSSLGALRML